MSGDIDRALAAAAALLQQLPRGRHETRLAREQFAPLKTSHADLMPQLVAHPVPASDAVDYDVLLTRAGAGTLSLTWRADDGVPWAPEHADHWASNFVLSIDAFSVSIQSALLYLNGIMSQRPRVMERLVSRTLFDIAIAEADIAVSDQEVEDAVDAFRSTQGLFTGAATQQWLDERQLSMDALREMVRDTAIARKFKDGLTRDRIAPYFSAHRAEFDRVRVLRVDNVATASAQQFAEAWRGTGVCPVLGGDAAFADCTARLDRWCAMDLAPEFAVAAVGEIVGPVEGEQDGTSSVGQVLSREAAVLDADTRARIHELLLDRWVAERRAAANVQWHWV